MDREDDGTQRIYDTAVICSNLFEQCVNSSIVPSPKSKDDFATELRGRFNLWAAYVGAFAAPKASLDARLVAHGDIRDMVVDLLVMIQANMRHGILLCLLLLVPASSATSFPVVAVVQYLK